MNAHQQRIAAERLAMRRSIIRSNGTTWPGGYPIVAVMDDGGMLCHKCCRMSEVYRSTRDGDRDGWTIVGLDTHMEGPDIQCDHCGTLIPSAYGDDDQ